MTKAELEKEADEFTDSKKSFWRQGRTCIESVKQAYVAGAEPREKRIEELEKEIEEIKSNNNVYCEGEGETLVVNVSFDKFTRINANHKMYYPRNEELEKENAELKEKAERYYCLLEKSMDCEVCKYCDFSDDMKKEPCNSCFFDSSKWELKEEKE